MSNSDKDPHCTMADDSVVSSQDTVNQEDPLDLEDVYLHQKRLRKQNNWL